VSGDREFLDVARRLFHSRGYEAVGVDAVGDPEFFTTWKEMRTTRRQDCESITVAQLLREVSVKGTDVG
jgi:hypothetical protein